MIDFWPFLAYRGLLGAWGKQINNITTLVVSDMSAKTLKDGVLKGLILQAVLDDKTSSHTIYQAIDYQNYNAFLVALNRLTRYGYLSKIGTGRCKNTKPLKYSLTKKGVLHAHNPLLNIQHRENYIQKRAMEIRLDSDEAQHLIEQRAQVLAGSIRAGSDGGDGGIVPEYDDMMGGADAVEHRHGIITKTEPKPLSEWQIKAKARHERRLPIVEEYKTEYLDERFFKLWKGIYPYLMKGKTFDKGVPGSVEIFSISNPEVAQRKHTKGRLTAEQIYLSEFRIDKVKMKDGKILSIVIDGRGLRKPYEMRLA